MSDDATASASRFRRRVIVLLSAILLVIVATAITVTTMIVTAVNDAHRDSEIAKCQALYSVPEQVWSCIERAGYSAP